MTDIREQLLAQLVEIAANAGVFKQVYRNRSIQPDADLRPALYILDAHESEGAETENVWKQLGHAMMEARPEIVISLGATPEDIGTSLNTLRAAFLKALFADTVLPGIIGRNGTVRYKGCATDLTTLASSEGEMGLAVTILYHFDPSKL
jgi:hypothetical protein